VNIEWFNIQNKGQVLIKIVVIQTLLSFYFPLLFGVWQFIRYTNIYMLDNWQHARTINDYCFCFKFNSVKKEDKNQSKNIQNKSTKIKNKTKTQTKYKTKRKEAKRSSKCNQTKQTNKRKINIITNQIKSKR